MPAVSTTFSQSDGVDCEPDDEWKEQLRKRIEEGLQSMVTDAKENLAAELRKAPDTLETRMRLEADYKQAMQTIRSLASEQYQLELDRERNQRRWTAGVPMSAAWTHYFQDEQQNIMNSIKQSSNQTDNPVRTASESPTEERRSAIPKPNNEPPALAPPVLHVPPTPSVRSVEEREKSFASPQRVRWGSDVRTVSRDRDEHTGSFRRSHHASVHERPSLPESWIATETVEEPEELVRSPAPRARLSSIDRPSRWDASLGRSSGSIHSRAHPEVWKPAISPAKDALPAKTFNLGRRGSATSMRSTGSGTSIRPSIKATIHERTDDKSAIKENDNERVQETARSWIFTDKSPKEKQPHPRRNGRQSTVDTGLRSDEPIGSSRLRSASSSTMQYSSLSPPNRSLSANPSLKFDDRNHPNDSPGKPPPYYEYRERDSYSHREQQVPSQDQLSARPMSARSAYGGDDRDYDPQYSTPYRTHGPKPPYHYPQRESRPIFRQTSFTRQPYVEVDDGDDKRGDRGERHRDRERERWESRRPTRPRDDPDRGTSENGSSWIIALWKCISC